MYPKPARPIGITLLSILFIWIGGLGTLFLPIILFAGTSRVIVELCENQLHWPHTLSFVAATLLCSLWYLAYILYLFIGIGLWKLKRLALKAMIVVQWFGIGMAAIASLVTLRYAPLMALGVGVWCAGIVGCFLWYLTRPAVRWPFEVTYAAAHGQTPPPPPPPSTTARWKRVSTGVGVAAIILTIFATTLFLTVEKSFQSSDIYMLSMKEAQESPCVSSTLGSPLVPDGMISGSLSSGQSEGSANLSIPVRGPKAKANLFVNAEKLDGSWTFHMLALDSNNQRVQILPTPSTCNQN